MRGALLLAFAAEGWARRGEAGGGRGACSGVCGVTGRRQRHGRRRRGACGTRPSVAWKDGFATACRSERAVRRSVARYKPCARFELPLPPALSILLQSHHPSRHVPKIGAARWMPRVRKSCTYDGSVSTSWLKKVKAIKNSARKIEAHVPPRPYERPTPVDTY